MTEEDEAFNEIERQAKQRKESVRAAINKDKPMNEAPTAFPWTHGDLTCTGMTLRDYFAAKAMQADLTGYDGTNWSRVAVHAYQMADAMLKARET
jgi:hypothetical protein